MLNIYEAIKEAAEMLRASGISQSRREAKSLLSLAIKKGSAFLIAYPEYELTEKEKDLFKSFVKRRVDREPFQHIAGKQEFWKLDFVVNPDVMIPRPETELIVEAGINILRGMKSQRFCEVGVGSGCISVSMLHEIKHARAVGLDISKKALQIAKRNAQANNVMDRFYLKRSNVFEAVDKNEEFDLVVSNPPYVPSKSIETLPVEVRDFEPHVALTDGKDGLSIINKIIYKSPKYLKKGGFLLMEIGFNQSIKVCEMFSVNSWESVELFPDLQGIQRIVRAKLKT